MMTFQKELYFIVGKLEFQLETECPVYSLSYEICFFR